MLSEVTAVPGLKPNNILVFINAKSGGRQGEQLEQKFAEYVPADRIIDIQKEKGPKNALEKFIHIKNLRILAAGGDGTGNWVLQTMDEMEIPPEERPPVAILPLGTGNDIGRALGWGGGFEGEGLGPWIDNVIEAIPVKLDRWIMKREGGDKPKEYKLNNYFSIGFCDAKAALKVHELRESHPHLFFSRGINKVWYGMYAAQTIVRSAPVDKWSDIVELEVDGKPVKVEDNIEGVIVLNLLSYAGGMNLWGTINEDSYQPHMINDGLLEVLGVHSSMELAKISMGKMDGCVRLGQGKDVRITYKHDQPPLPCKVDGEPWLQEDPATFHITHFNLQNMLAKKGSIASHCPPELHGWFALNRKSSKKLDSKFFLIKDSMLYQYDSYQQTTPEEKFNLHESSVWLSEPHVIKVIMGSNVVHLYAEGTNQNVEKWIDHMVSSGAVKQDKTRW